MYTLRTVTCKGKLIGLKRINVLELLDVIEHGLINGDMKGRIADVTNSRKVESEGEKAVGKIIEVTF